MTKVKLNSLDDEVLDLFNTKASTALATVFVAGLLSTTDKIKLDGISSGATANDTDANLKSRANHTGTQAISTVSGLQTALDGRLCAWSKERSPLLGRR